LLLDRPAAHNVGYLNNVLLDTTALSAETKK